MLHALLAVLTLLVASGGCSGGAAPDSTAALSASGDAATVRVRAFDDEGVLRGPVEAPRVDRPESEWRAQLTPDQYEVVRRAGTERAFTVALLKNKDDGVYTCVACALPLFDSDAKFDSGTGWPSYFRPIAPENVVEHQDQSYGMVRSEILCARCGGHLGHVFNDGPAPTDLRYCVNSVSLSFTPKKELASLADSAVTMTNQPHRDSASTTTPSSSTALATAVFAGGCFWCVEAVFEELDGVIEVISGYAGGTADTANYKAVGAGQTDHAEAVEIIYDPASIPFEDLLRVHFSTHDPTQLNRQGNDVGPQYRSTIFYANDDEQAIAVAFIAELKEQHVFDRPIVTTLEPLTKFYPAETYHQNYVCNNPNQGYVRAIALPKVEKVRKMFKDRLKEQSPLEGSGR